MHTVPMIPINLTVTFPLAKTIAFGGVPIGKRSAREIHSVTGASSSNGCLPRAGAKQIIAGRIIFATATLDIMLVKRHDNREVVIKTPANETLSLLLKDSNQLDKPLS